MDAPSLLKALLINAAYEGAIAVCSPLQTDDGKPLTIDPLIQDVGLQKKGVLVYEEAKVQYNALLRAFQDHSGVWPDPKVPADGTPASSAGLNGPALLSQGVALLSKLPRETPLGTLGQVLDVISKLGPDLPKQPGQELKTS
jgi:hypothetical protein